MEALCGVSTWEEHTEERKWEVLERRGHSEAIFALAVPTWHRTIHRTVFYRLNGKVWSPKYQRGLTEPKKRVFLKCGLSPKFARFMIGTQRPAVLWIFICT